MSAGLRHTLKEQIASLILREMESKLQWGITSCWSEWPTSKHLRVSAGEGVKKRETSYTVGGKLFLS